ncbi:MAG: PA0069 family radical SAM protein [bacterium]
MSLLAVQNPPNPWASTDVEWIGPPPVAKLQIYLDQTREILARNDSPDLPFTWSVNPYRGCFHGCAYCYARPSHEYLSFGAGTDFERRIVVKPEAPRLLAEAFARPKWKGELILFSGNTDAYQPLEAAWKLTRGCLEVCLAHHNPVAIITKAPLVERDAELLARLGEVAHAPVTISIPFANAEHARALEPTVPPPARRFETIRRLAAAGVRVGVNVAPIIPGLSDDQIVEVLERARDAGATYAGMTLVRLPGPVAEVFGSRVQAAFPDRAERILHRIQDVRGGKINQAAFGTRMRGEGVYADAIHMLFKTTSRRMGYQALPPVPEPSPFRRPEVAAPAVQLGLFD